MRYLFLVIISLAALCVAQARGDAPADAPFTVVLDPGHGGHDPGCEGKLTNEKTIVLDVAKRLGKMITDEYGDKVRVVYTRDNDRFITLADRARKANEAKGDLFISIHVNSVDRKSRNRTTVQGTSVYTCGLHRSESNLRVAMRENAVMELEPDFTASYQGFDPESSESYIMFEFLQGKHLEQSIEFASLAQERLIADAGRADKDVRQAGFWVLWATSMPSVLVELDFICNPTQERFLNSADGRKQCASALFNAFKAYYTRQIKQKS